MASTTATISSPNMDALDRNQTPSEVAVSVVDSLDPSTADTTTSSLSATNDKQGTSVSDIKVTTRSTEKPEKEASVKFESSNYLSTDSDDDDEDVDELSDLSSPTKTLEERSVKAPKRVKQIIQYTKLMEDRVQALEAQVKGLLGSSRTELDAENSAEPAKPPIPTSPGPESKKKNLISLDTLRLIPIIGRLNEADYKEGHKIHDRKRHVIDVWMPDSSKTAIEETLSSSKIPKPEQTQNKVTLEHQRANTENSTTQSTAANKTSVQENSQQPKRIRINSTRLLRDLLQVTKQVVDLSLRQFLPPFQIFALYEKDMRNRVAELEKECYGDRELAVEESMASASIPETTAESSSRLTGPDVGTKQPSTTSADQAGEASRKFEDVRNEKEGKADMVDLESGTHVLEVMDRCHIGLQRATEVLSQVSDPDLAIAKIKGSQTEEEERGAHLGYSKLLLEEWKALIELLDVDLKSMLNTCAKIRDGTLKAIAYRDLIHLFNPGDIVLSTQDRRLQALTVWTASGGRALLTETLASDSSDLFSRNLGDTSYPSNSKTENFLLPVEKQSPFTVHCWHYDFDGVNPGTITKSIVIPKYDGMKVVTSLLIYPMKFHEDFKGDILTELEARGDKFIALCTERSGAHRQYYGRTLDDNPEEVDSQVIVDYQMAALVHPGQRPDESRWMPIFSLDPPTEPDEREISERALLESCDCSVCRGRSSRNFFNDQRMNRQRAKEYTNTWEYSDSSLAIEDIAPKFRLLLPPRMFGFVLRTRKWARLNIDNIEEITIEDITSDKTTNDKGGFKKLVLPDGFDDLVLALVKTHFKEPLADSEKAKFRHEVDLVRGKGRGLIILLHGAPGVGKTTTAESVAEYTGRPLFPITCGDIGDTAKDVEETLDRCFQMAHRWGCVLLLDEADVFLAKRDKQDLKRNAMVSVFLRVLEYYAGILFLTTNRVGAFDDAFKSRIHMSLYYPPLGLEPTTKVWQMNIDRTRQNMDHIKIEERKILEFAKNHFIRARDRGRSTWNGRQIRNAFQTAIALAEWDAKNEAQESGKVKPPRLSKAHFKTVAKVSSDFDEYLEIAHGEDEQRRAFTRQERAMDDWQDWPSEAKVKTPSLKSKKAVDDDRNRKKSKSGRKVLSESDSEVNGKKSKKTKSKAQKVEIKEEDEDEDANSDKSSSSASEK